MQVRELVTKLGFDADTKQAETYDQTLADVRRTAMRAAAAVGALAAGTVLLARRMADTGNEVAKSAVEAGLAADEFQQLTFAIGQVTRLSDQQAQQALMRLNDTIGRARIEGGRYAESLERLGFSQEEIQSGTIDNAEAFARVTEEIGKTENAQDAAALASRVLGERVGRQLGPALRENAEGLLRAREEAERLGGGWSDLALNEAEELTDSFGRVGLITTTLTSTLAEKLLPIVREAVDAFVDWFSSNRELILQNMRRWMEGLASAMRVVRTIVGALIRGVNRVVEAMGGWESTIRLLTIALTTFVALKVARWIWGVAGALVAAAAQGRLLRTVMMALSRIPIIAAFIALIYVIEDLITWISGGDSAIGRWLGTWEDFREKAIAAMTDILEYLDPLIRQFQAVGEIIAGALTLDPKRILEGFRSLGTAIVDWAKQLGSSIREAILDALPDWMVTAIEKAGGVVGDAADAVRAPLDRAVSEGERIGGLLSFGGSDRGDSDGTDAGVRMGETFGGRGRDPGTDMQRLGSDRRVEINARTEATLQVPQGTTEEQRRAIEQQADEIFGEHWDREMRRALWDFQPVE